MLPVNRIPEILKRMDINSSQAEAMKTCFGILAIMSREEGNKVLIAKDGIEIILNAMTIHIDRTDVQEAGCDLLWSLAFNSSAVKELIAKSSGAVVLVRSLKRHNRSADFLKSACGALSNICQFRQNQEAVASQGGLQPLVGSIHVHQINAKLLPFIFDAVASIIVNNEENARAVSSLGIIPVIVSSVSRHKTSKEVVKSGCHTLAILSDVKGQASKVAFAGGVGVILALLDLHPMYSDLHRVAAVVLLRMLQESTHVGREIVCQDGIRILLASLEKGGAQHDTVAAVTHILYTITNPSSPVVAAIEPQLWRRNTEGMSVEEQNIRSNSPLLLQGQPSSLSSQGMTTNLSGISMILTQYSSRRDVVRAACRLISNLSHFERVVLSLDHLSILGKVLACLAQHRDAKDVLETTILLLKQIQRVKSPNLDGSLTQLTLQGALYLFRMKHEDEDLVLFICVLLVNIIREFYELNLAHEAKESNVITSSSSSSSSSSINETIPDNKAIWWEETFDTTIESLEKILNDTSYSPKNATTRIQYTLQIWKLLKGKYGENMKKHKSYERYLQCLTQLESLYVQFLHDIHWLLEKEIPVSKGLEDTKDQGKDGSMANGLFESRSMPSSLLNTPDRSGGLRTPGMSNSPSANALSLLQRTSPTMIGHTPSQEQITSAELYNLTHSPSDANGRKRYFPQHPLKSNNPQAKLLDNWPVYLERLSDGPAIAQMRVNGMMNGFTDSEVPQRMHVVYESCSPAGKKITSRCPTPMPYQVPIEGVGPAFEHSLTFDSDFESGNLQRAVQIGDSTYDLVLRTDVHTSGHTQWFYFAVSNTHPPDLVRLADQGVVVPSVRVTFHIINFTKPDSLFNLGMRPVVYSVHDAEHKGIGWVRQGYDISYYSNVFTRANPAAGEGNSCYFTLSFSLEFTHPRDTVLVAYSYPYTLSDYRMHIDDLLTKRGDIVKKCKLCTTLFGEDCDLITITDFNDKERNGPVVIPELDKFLDELHAQSCATPSSLATAPFTISSKMITKLKSLAGYKTSTKGSDNSTTNYKPAIVISGRVHPGETPASWMMKGILDFLTSDHPAAKLLRSIFVMYIVPVLNPDGVIFGNNRCSLAGVDLNRQWKTPARQLHPTIFYLKLFMNVQKKLRDIAMFLDLHGHSRKYNVFMYGCDDKKKGIGKPQVRGFPRFLSNHNLGSKYVSFNDCSFHVKKGRESTARVVVAKEMNIPNSFTLEATFCGANYGPLKHCHMNIGHLQEVGVAVCDAFLNYSLAEGVFGKDALAIVPGLASLSSQLMTSPMTISNSLTEPSTPIANTSSTTNNTNNTSTSFPSKTKNKSSSALSEEGGVSGSQGGGQSGGVNDDINGPDSDYVSSDSEIEDTTTTTTTTSNNILSNHNHNNTHNNDMLDKEIESQRSLLSSIAMDDAELLAYNNHSQHHNNTTNALLSRSHHFPSSTSSSISPTNTNNTNNLNNNTHQGAMMHKGFKLFQFNGPEASSTLTNAGVHLIHTSNNSISSSGSISSAPPTASSATSLHQTPTNSSYYSSQSVKSNHIPDDLPVFHPTTSQEIIDTITTTSGTTKKDKRERLKSRGNNNERSKTLISSSAGGSNRSRNTKLLLEGSIPTIPRSRNGRTSELEGGLDIKSKGSTIVKGEYDDMVLSSHPIITTNNDLAKDVAFATSFALPRVGGGGHPSVLTPIPNSK